MIAVMGVDSSTKTGLCVLSGDRVVQVAKEVTDPGTGLARARAIAAKVEAAAVGENVQLVVIEGYGFANTYSLVTLVEIGTLIRDRLWKSGIRYVVVAPTQVKKFVLGKGVGKKDQMRLGVFKRWGFEHESDNVVDAYGLGVIGLAWLGEVPGLIAPQVEVINKLPPRPEGPTVPRRDR